MKILKPRPLRPERIVPTCIWCGGRVDEPRHDTAACLVAYRALLAELDS